MEVLRCSCLCARKELESSFHDCGGPVKLVQARLCARKDLESSFHQCGGPVERYKKAVLTTVEVL